MENVQRNYVGGTWVPAGATTPNVNPSNLNDVVANYARAQPAEAEAAIAAAKAAFSAYSRRHVGALMALLDGGTQCPISRWTSTAANHSR